MLVQLNNTLKALLGTNIQAEGIVTQGSSWEKEIKSDAIMSQMVELAQISKASIQKFVDYVASIIVSTTVSLSLITLLNWCIVGIGILGAYPKEIMMNGSLSFHKWEIHVATIKTGVCCRMVLGTNTLQWWNTSGNNLKGSKLQKGRSIHVTSFTPM